MGELVTVLNAAGGAFVAFAAHMLIQSSVLIILLAALDLVLRRRVKAVVRYWIWLLVLAKLILPPSFSSPTGVAYWVGGELPTLSGPIEPVVGESFSPSLPPDATAVPSEPQGPDSRPSVRHAPEEPPVARPDNTPLSVTPHVPLVTWQALVLLGWAVAVIVMGVLLAQRALFIHRLVAQSRAPGPEIVELLGQCARRMGVRTDLAVKLSPLSASPSVCGLWRPVILIPEGMLARLSVPEVRSVLFHELAHIKRGDLWLNLLQAVLQVVYFYHPLLWAANARIRRVREQAVDETVLAALGEEAEDYPRTLLSVSRVAFGQPTVGANDYSPLLGVVESENALMDRIRHIVSRPFPNSAKLGLAGLALVLLVAVVLLPMARAERTTGTTIESAGSSVPAVALDNSAAGADILPPRDGSLISPAVDGAGGEISGGVVDSKGEPIAGADMLPGTDAPQVRQTTFAGRILDAAGRPVGGAKVRLYQDRYGGLLYLSEIVVAGEVTTEAEGLFSFRVRAEDDSYRYRYVVAEKDGLAIGFGPPWDITQDQTFDIILGEAKPLAGVVVDERGAPVSDATVCILRLRVARFERQYDLNAGLATQWLMIRTDDAGRFAFANLPGNVSAELLVRKPGRATVSTPLGPTNASRQPLSLAPGQTDIRLTQPVEAKMQGMVVQRQTGQPVAGVKLVVTYAGGRALDGHDTVSSRHDGTFHISALLAGQHILRLVPPSKGLADWVAAPVPVTCEVGVTTAEVKVEVSKGGIVEAVVADTGTNTPIEGMSVRVRCSQSGQSFHGTSDTEGIARIRVVPGVYEVQTTETYAYQAGLKTVTVGEGEMKHLTIALEPMPRIRGVVRDPNGAPLMGAHVSVLPMGCQDATSDSEGAFEVTWNARHPSARRAEFCLLAWHEQYNLADVVNITEGTTSLDVKLKPGVVIAGRIADPDGKGIAGAYATPHLLRPTTNQNFFMKRTAVRTDSNGRFEIRAMPAEHACALLASADGYGLTEMREMNAQNATNGRLDLGVLTIRPADLSAAGQVVDVHAHPVAGATVSIHGGGQIPWAPMQTDAEGHFIFRNVCAGRIRVQASARNAEGRLVGAIETHGGATDVKVVIKPIGADGRYGPAQPPSQVGDQSPAP